MAGTAASGQAHRSPCPDPGPHANRLGRWLAALVPLVPAMLLLEGAARDLAQAVVEVGCVLVCCRHLGLTPAVRHPGVLLIVLGIAVTVLGDLVAFFSFNVLGTARLSPAREVIVVVGYAFLSIGAVMVARRATRGAGRGGWVEAAVFGLGALAPVLAFLVLPALQQRIQGAGLTTLTVYAAALVLLVTVLARLLLTQSLDPTSLVYFCLSGLATLAADFVAALGGATGRDEVGARMLWMACYLLFTAGLVHPSLPQLLDGHARDDEAVSVHRRVLLLTTGLIVPAGALTVGLGIGYTPHVWSVAAISLVVSVLVAFRMVRLMARVAAQSEQLALLARHDELTGLPNRRSWNHELPRACAAATLSGAPLAVAILDLDHFKTHNDTHGHQAGDALLQATARIWMSHLRTGEYLARYGGEEFALLITGLEGHRVLARIDELRALAPAPTTASAGVAIWTPGTEGERLVAEADAALYLAKEQGRARTVLASGVPARAAAGR